MPFTEPGDIVLRPQFNKTGTGLPSGAWLQRPRNKEEMVSELEKAGFETGVCHVPAVPFRQASQPLETSASPSIRRNNDLPSIARVLSWLDCRCRVAVSHRRLPWSQDKLLPPLFPSRSSGPRASPGCPPESAELQKHPLSVYFLSVLGWELWGNDFSGIIHTKL